MKYGHAHSSLQASTSSPSIRLAKKRHFNVLEWIHEFVIHKLINILPHHELSEFGQFEKIKYLMHAHSFFVHCVCFFENWAAFLNVNKLLVSLLLKQEEVKTKRRTYHMDSCKQCQLRLPAQDGTEHVKQRSRADTGSDGKEHATIPSPHFSNARGSMAKWDRTQPTPQCL